ncbi:MAG: hypothetical protein R3185_00765 [Candidatus Thermoplasmatota archaeon]|nr:hypothetical protein [Candidatus Thermoplasmatota archaeon]
MIQRNYTAQGASYIRPDIASTLDETVLNLKELEGRIQFLKQGLVNLSNSIGHPNAARLALAPNMTGLTGYGQIPTPSVQASFQGTPWTGPIQAPIHGPGTFYPPQVNSMPMHLPFWAPTPMGLHVDPWGNFAGPVDAPVSAPVGYGPSGWSTVGSVPRSYPVGSPSFVGGTGNVGVPTSGFATPPTRYW